MRIYRARWLDNFEDGTFETYWSHTISGGTAVLLLQDDSPVKDGTKCLQSEFNLNASSNIVIRKEWTTPQLDLTSYSRIYCWVRQNKTCTFDMALRNDGSYGSYGTCITQPQTGEWVLTYFTLSGTRDQVDGIRFRCTDTQYGSSTDIWFRIDTLCAIRTDTDHTYNFGDGYESSLTKTNGKDLILTDVPGRRVTTIRDRGPHARVRAIAGEFTSLSQKQSLEDVLRSGDNLFLFTALGEKQAIVGRVFAKTAQQLAGITEIYPYSISIIESLESSI